MDRYPHEGVDVVHDLDQVPWPFADESVDYIWASHVLEHVASLERTIREVHRILRVGGVLEVRVPYGIKSLFNPFHLRAFDRTSFDLFAKMDQSTGLRRGSTSTRGSCGDCRRSGTCGATCRGSSDTSTAGDRPPGGGPSSGEGVRSMLR